MPARRLAPPQRSNHHLDNSFITDSMTHNLRHKIAPNSKPLACDPCNRGVFLCNNPKLSSNRLSNRNRTTHRLISSLLSHQDILLIAPQTSQHLGYTRRYR